MSDIVKELLAFLTMEDHPGDVAFLEAIEEAADEIERKDAEIERLRAALKPFADAADLAERNLCKHNTDEILIRLGHLRKARAALTASEGEAPKTIP